MSLRRAPGRLLLIVCLLAAAGTPAYGEEQRASRPLRQATLVEGLRSSLAARRKGALELAVAEAGRVRPWAREWATAEDALLREASWNLLARIGEGQDLRAAVRGLEDRQPTVAARAAAALVLLSETLPPPSEPWIPADTLPKAAARSLAFALGRRLERATPGTLPPCIYRLGQGSVPALHRLAKHARFGPTTQDRALRSLSVIGGDGARAALGELAAHVNVNRRGAWWTAIAEIGPGAGLAPAHAVVLRKVRASIKASGHRPSSSVPGPSGLHRRYHGQFYRFLRSAPPTEGIEDVRNFLLGRLSAASNDRLRLMPSIALEIVRAHLAVSEPDDESLRLIVLCAYPYWRGGFRRRVEELGNVLLIIEPYRDREAVQDALDELLEDAEELPATVKALALFLRGETPIAELTRLARRLIDGAGGAATVAQRRIGAQLLDRLGAPPPVLIKALATDLDGWMRAMSLRWALAAYRRGALSEGERDAALQRALADEDNGAFLLGLEIIGTEATRAQRERALQMAVAGPRKLRKRCWEALRGALKVPAAVRKPGWRVPARGAGLDARIRAAGVYRGRIRD